MNTNLVISGFGGQGILLSGLLLAESAMFQGYNVTYFPSYGVEMRGGTANCTVVISEREIGSPVVSAPEVVIAMSEQAREKFEPRLQPDGIFILNSSLAQAEQVSRADLELLAFPFNQLALELGNPRLANMIALGVYLAKKPVVELKIIEEVLKQRLGNKSPKLAEANLQAIKKGLELAGGR